MKLRRIINGHKTVLDPGSWKSGAKMPKAAFPLSKSSTFKISGQYNWRVVRFRTQGETFRLLIAYRLDLSRFLAQLGLECGADMKVLARYEYHATEPGWHWHVVCDATTQVAGRQGVTDKRIPGAEKLHKDLAFGISGDTAAYQKAIKAFRLHKQPSKLFGV